MKNMLLVILLLAAFVALPNSAVRASAGTAYPWKDHAAPYNFLFGNHIDTHQQSQKLAGGQLQGILYIRYTGETIDGIPVAEHTDCSMDPAACVAGWVFQGVPAQAAVVSMDEMGMPRFCASAAILRKLVGFSHFHWLGEPMMDMDLLVGQIYSGYLLKLTALSAFYFRHHSEMILVTPGVDTASHANITPCN